jgi:ubiquinone/menaquinone biosynthesis C-methylase UbiE
LPKTAEYIWLDNDQEKLRGFSAKGLKGRTILCDATRIPLPDKSVDYATCVGVAHHLSDEELAVVLKEIARIVRTRLVLLDPVWWPASWVSRLMWSYDRGTHPRTADALLAAVGHHFEVGGQERFAIYHRYVLVEAKPR